METALKKDIYDCMTCVWSGTSNEETGEECIIPDTMPDVGEIVGTDTILTLRGKETELGSVRITGSVSVSVLYAPEEGTELKNLELILPLEVRMDAPGVDSECVAVVQMRVRSVDARILNSRKISVRAELETESSCYHHDRLEIAAGVVSEETIHVLEKTMGVMMISDVREKTFAVTDELRFPEDISGRIQLISRRIEPMVEDVKYVSGKAVFHGIVKTELMFSEKESGRLFIGRYETEFSQIMETGDGDLDGVPEISLFLTGAYFDLPEYGGTEGKIQSEIHLAAQCVCRQRRDLSYLEDLYSNQTELIPVKESITVMKSARQVTARQTVVGQADVSAGDGEVINASVSVRGVAWDEGAVKTSVQVRLLCRDPEGKYFSSRSRMSAEFTMSDIPAEARLSGIDVSVADIYCQSLHDDIRVTLRMDATVFEEDTITCVCRVEEGTTEGESITKHPSMVLVRVKEGADLWSIARKYHSTREAIAAVNDGRTSGLLLIPKAR